MSFKYCSFYGISGPIALLFSKNEIDNIFKHAMSGPVQNLLYNLRIELVKLKEILTDKNVIGLEEDSSSKVIELFLRGLNHELSKKSPATTNTANKTSMFLDEDLSNMLNDFLGPTTLNSDLIAVGKQIPRVTNPRFSNLLQVKQYILTSAKSELSAEELTSLKKQLSELPRRPSGRVYINGQTVDLKVRNPAVYQLLLSIYSSAFTLVDDMPKIDYLIYKIEGVLGLGSGEDKTLLGYPYDRLKGISNIFHCNRHNLAVLNGALATSNLRSKVSVIDRLLKDCDVLLSNTSQNVDLIKTAHIDLEKASSMDIAATILSTPAFVNAGLTDAHHVLSELITLFDTRGTLAELLHNHNELLFLTLIFHKLFTLEHGGAISGWGLYNYVSSPRDVNKLGIELAKLLKIGGVYIGYEQQFYNTAKIIDRLYSRSTFAISKTDNPELYNNIELLRRHLLSLRERIA